MSTAEATPAIDRTKEQMEGIKFVTEQVIKVVKEAVIPILENTPGYEGSGSIEIAEASFKGLTVKGVKLSYSLKCDEGLHLKQVR